MSTAYLVTKPWLGTIDPKDLVFGQEMLGRFLGKLLEAPEKPSAVCFYTEGVKAALQGAPIRESLEALEQAGVPLLLCSTCIDHYGMEGKLLVGTVADMNMIGGALGAADKVITI